MKPPCYLVGDCFFIIVDIVKVGFTVLKGCNKVVLRLPDVKSLYKVSRAYGPANFIEIPPLSLPLG